MEGPMSYLETRISKRLKDVFGLLAQEETTTSDLEITQNTQATT